MPRRRLAAARELVRADPFTPPWWLRDSHAQTLSGAFLPRAAPGASEDWLVESEPGTRVLVHGHDLHVAPEGTTLVVVHGLGGSATSGHVLDVTRYARRRGLPVVRFNMRNCGGTEALTPTLYHANLTQDLRAVVDDVIARKKARHVVLAGYSVGGNLILNTLAEWGVEAPRQLVGGVVLCPAIDISASVERLDSAGNALYRRFFLKQLVALHERKSAVNTGYAGVPARHLRRVRDFDREVTGPQAGFADVDEFYAWVSAAPRLARIARPTIIVHAEDDPIVHFLPSTRAAIAANSYLTLIDVPFGGHCGFTEAPSPARRDGRWAAHQLVRCAELLAIGHH